MSPQTDMGFPVGFCALTFSGTTPFAMAKIPRSDREGLLLREAVSPPDDFDLGILVIVYDGELSSGPVLTLVFRRPLSYDVSQGRDFRSIVVGVPGPERAEPCVPAN